MEDGLLKELLNVEDSLEIIVRFNDTNAIGAVHFKKYLEYFDDGFVSFMNNIQDPLATENVFKSGVIFPVKKIDIEYNIPAEFGDHVIIKTHIKNIEEMSIVFVHEIYRESDNALLAEIECVRLVMDLESKELVNAKQFFSKFV